MDLIHHPLFPWALVSLLWLLSNWLKLRRQRKKAAEERFATGSLRSRVMARDGHRCVDCGHPGSDDNPLQVDHVRPWSRGGKTVLDNLQVLCKYHNMKKGASYDAA